MLVKNPKYRKQLSDKQIRIILIACKFRFVTVATLSDWLEKDKSTAYEHLIGLVEQGYLFKQYDTSYRLLHKPASYGLAPKGIKYVRDNFGSKVSETTLRNMYKNRTASEALVVQSLNTFKLCRQLRNQYPDVFEIFTKTDMARFEMFIRPLPDIYLKRNNKKSTEPSYIVETIEEGTLSFVLRKRLQAYDEHFGQYSYEWHNRYPTLLLICGNANTEKRIHRLAQNAFFNFKVMTTTNKRLETGDVNVWLAEWWQDEKEVRVGLNLC